jgi:hypothetical protein
MTDWFGPRLELFLSHLSEPQAVVALLFAGIASVLVIVGTVTKTMIPLRWLTVGSNIGFIVYGVLMPVPLLVLLHAVLLPINLWRLRQMIQLTQRVRARGQEGAQLELWLRPYMRARTHRAGSVIFERGAVADRMYFLAEGTIELPEVGGRLEAGQMFGEIAFFAPDRRRTSSARCLTPCTLLSIDEDTFKQLVYQNPEFGFQVVQLIAQRLSGDVRRLQQQRAGSGEAPVA